MNKKTIAVKQDDKTVINRGVLDMTPAELAKLRLAMEQILLNRGLRGILSQIGIVHEIPFSDGRKTLSVMLTYEGIKGLGIDLNTVFKGSGGREEFNVKTDVKNGVLVNLDLYQQVTILRAIIEKKTELQDVLGLYNLRGSRKVYEVLSSAGASEQLGIWWMWTADVFVPSQFEVNYPEEGIVTLSNLSTLKDYRFIFRIIDYDYWYDNNPDFHDVLGVAVFGGLKF